MRYLDASITEDIIFQRYYVTIGNSRVAVSFDSVVQYHTSADTVHEVYRLAKSQIYKNSYGSKYGTIDTWSEMHSCDNSKKSEVKKNKKVEATLCSVHLWKKS